jgi:hypothetical protein
MFCVQIETAPEASRGGNLRNTESDAIVRIAYHSHGVAATVETRGRSGEGRTMHDDVRLAYNAAARDKRDRNRTGAPIFSKAGKTANELRLIYRDGWGVLDDDREGRGLFAILLHTIAHTGGYIAAKMTAAWREFAPWMSAAELGRSLPMTRARDVEGAMREHGKWTTAGGEKSLQVRFSF